jgi:hypothetical protein
MRKESVQLKSNSCSEPSDLQVLQWQWISGIRVGVCVTRRGGDNNQYKGVRTDERMKAVYQSASEEAATGHNRQPHYYRYNYGCIDIDIQCVRLSDIKDIYIYHKHEFFFF